MKTILRALACAALAVIPTVSHGAPARSGQALYEYFCYQCHGYAGDARTVAAAYLEPKPRNFTTASPTVLTRAVIVRTLEHGIPGTGMKSFVRVLDARDRAAVADYIRTAFMRKAPLQRRYHTVENGWRDHERAAAAFPFATGATPIDTPVETLDAKQAAGRRLFLSACVTCHEGTRNNADGPQWDPRALSFPRSVETCDGCHESARMLASKGDTPHGRPARSPAAPDGQTLFRRNCAFCHGADGSGRNWIGTFLEPHARDLRQPRITAMSAQSLAAIVGNGLPGTSMPAWKDILSPSELLAVADYVRTMLASHAALPRRDDASITPTTPASPLQWKSTRQGNR